MAPVRLRHAPRPQRVLLEEVVFGLRVERGRRLVEQQQQRGLSHHGAAERELLPLAAAEVGAANVRLAEHRGREPVAEPAHARLRRARGRARR